MQIAISREKSMSNLITLLAKTVIFISAFWALSLISVLLHEFGHALGYMIATGDRNWNIQIGQGKQLLKTKALTVNMIVIDGFFEPVENKIDSKTQLVMTLSGGPVMSLLLVARLLVLKFGRTFLSSGIIDSGLIKAFFYSALFINFFILLWSVIPARGFFRNMDDVGTDVMQIIDALRDPRK